MPASSSQDEETPPKPARKPWWRRVWQAMHTRFARQAAVVAVAIGTFAAIGHFIGGMIGWWHAYELTFGHADKPAPAAEATVPRNAPTLSIVLLPLETQEQTSDLFADALTAELTAELGRIASAFVISRDTAFTYKGKTTDPREISRSLGVRYVVRGTVRRSGEQVRLALAMIDGESGAQRWAQSFEIERAHLGPSLDLIAQQVARSLNVEMYRSGGKRAAALNPEQVQADDMAMQGWALYFRGVSRENFLAALPLFEQAVAKDPDSTLGWGGIAIVNSIGATLGWIPDRDQAMRRLEAAAARLEEIDSDHLYTFLAKGHVANQRRDYEAFALVAKTAIERYPNHAPSYQALGSASMSLGRFDDCVDWTLRAVRLSPRDPTLGIWNWQIGTCHFLGGRYKEAAEYSRLASQLSPNLPLPPLVLAASLAREGKPEEARAIVDAYRHRHPAYRAADVSKILRSEHPRLGEGRAQLIASLRELGMP